MVPAVLTVADLRRAVVAWREKGDTLALVPTMGALHAGHMALVAEAKKIARRVVVSIFVNPAQFGPDEDLSRYPRQLEQDKRLLAEAGCDLLFAPDAAAMYPQGFAAFVDPGPLATVLEGACRPGHFRGVATVVAKLLLQALPDAALFGEKDYQQLLVVRRVAKDLDIPVHIVGVPTVRDADGLALSSRNAYLSADERRRAVALPETLRHAAGAIGSGVDAAPVLRRAREELASAGFTVDYIELVDAATLVPLAAPGPAPARLVAAARMGATRLIDNVTVAGSSSVE